MWLSNWFTKCQLLDLCTNNSILRPLLLQDLSIQMMQNFTNQLSMIFTHSLSFNINILYHCQLEPIQIKINVEIQYSNGLSFILTQVTGSAQLSPDSSLDTLTSLQLLMSMKINGSFSWCSTIIKWITYKLFDWNSTMAVKRLHSNIIW